MIYVYSVGDEDTWVTFLKRWYSKITVRKGNANVTERVWKKWECDLCMRVGKVYTNAHVIKQKKIYFLENKKNEEKM